MHRWSGAPDERCACQRQKHMVAAGTRTADLLRKLRRLSVQLHPKRTSNLEHGRKTWIAIGA